ncbi:MAG: hypothetical protein JJ911_07860 [Rhizobiaceae bacterium]|nr:hypothetical protein [Rhizobiaceae bacterium]
MTKPAQPEKIGETPAYWTNNVKPFPNPVAQFRMAQLIDFDARLYENARIVYRFLCAWYHDGHGDALLSQRHVAKVMKQRAPEGAATLSNRTVGRAIIALMEAGWVARTFKGRGKGRGASRYVPVVNVLELAAQGKFPEPGQYGGPVEPGHSNGPPVGHANGPVTPEQGHPNGPKTHLPDPRTDARTGKGKVSADGGAAASAPAATSGFERIWKAYGKRGNKTKSREAFGAIVEPDVKHLAERAASWAASAKPGQNRMPLEKWLAEEKYDEADRRQAKRRREENVKLTEIIPTPPRCVAKLAGQIDAAKMRTEGGTTFVDIRLSDGGTRSICAEGEAGEQDRGQKELAQLSGILCRDIEKASDLVGLSVSLSVFDNGSAEWKAAA